MDSFRPHIIDFAKREPHRNITTNARLKRTNADHNEKQDQDTCPVEPVPQLRKFFAAHESRLQAIQDACSAAQGRAADLGLVLKKLSANASESTRQVRSFFASHDTNIEAVRVACERTQECSAELLQVLEGIFANSGC
jgi:hypothetical protein